MQEESADRRNAIIEQRAEQLAGVQERETEAASEHARNLMRIRAEHQTRLSAITDLRTPTEKAAADIAALADTAYAPWLAKIQELKREWEDFSHKSSGWTPAQGNPWVRVTGGGDELYNEAWR
jgi:hypothetical protein